jgi:hypothetical protein
MPSLRMPPFLGNSRMDSHPEARWYSRTTRDKPPGCIAVNMGWWLSAHRPGDRTTVWAAGRVVVTAARRGHTGQGCR